jgi:hypothetical protein
MTILSCLIVVFAVVGVLGGSAISKQDKYALQVPDGLARAIGMG